MSVAKRQVLSRNPDQDWLLCKAFFQDRVTDRDFMISPTTMEDWRKLFEVIRRHPSWTHGEPGTAGVIGEVVPSMFRNQGARGGCYFIRLEHGVLVCLWPTAAEFIEMDVEAHLVQDAQAFSALLGFIETIAQALGRTIGLAYDLDPKHGLIEYVWDAKQFVFQLPRGQ